MRQNMLDFNTSEIPNLSDPDWGGMRVVKHEHGYVVFVDGGADELLDYSIPKWFKRFHRAALDTNAVIVNFDSDSTGTLAKFTQSDLGTMSEEAEVVLGENIKAFINHLEKFCKSRAHNFATFDQSHLALLIAAWLDSFRSHSRVYSDTYSQIGVITKINDALLNAVVADDYSSEEFKGAMSKLTEIFPTLWD